MAGAGISARSVTLLRPHFDGVAPWPPRPTGTRSSAAWPAGRAGRATGRRPPISALRALTGLALAGATAIAQGPTAAVAPESWLSGKDGRRLAYNLSSPAIISQLEAYWAMATCGAPPASARPASAWLLANHIGLEAMPAPEPGWTPWSGAASSTMLERSSAGQAPRAGPTVTDRPA